MAICRIKGPRRLKFAHVVHRPCSRHIFQSRDPSFPRHARTHAAGSTPPPSTDPPHELRTPSTAIGTLFAAQKAPPCPPARAPCPPRRKRDVRTTSNDWVAHVAGYGPRDGSLSHARRPTLRLKPRGIISAALHDRGPEPATKRSTCARSAVSAAPAIVTSTQRSGRPRSCARTGPCRRSAC